MRLLALSIGNTSLRGAVFSGHRPVARFRAPADQIATDRGFARSIARRARGRIDRAVICSVVPALTGPLVRRIKRRFGVVAQVLTAGSRHGLAICYRRPAELGSDRLAAALGARALFPRRDVIVVDCGTATTVTALRRDGAILGGAILPGFGLWPEMLAVRTAQLPKAAVRKPRTAIGRSPREAIASGVFLGHVGAVREVVKRVRAEARPRSPGRGASAIVVGTGGGAFRFAAEDLFDAVEPDLVLQGLRAFSESFLRDSGWLA